MIKIKKTLIIGAGGAGRNVLRELEKIKKTEVVGFLDLDEKKHGEYICKYKVLGSYLNLEYFIKKYKVEKIIVATTSIDKKSIEIISLSAKKLNVKVLVLPPFEELLVENSLLKQVREINVVDLLGRPEINVSKKRLSYFIEEKIIMVTGAGGSIGSELVRQLIKHNPKKLIILDINENELYLLELFLKRNYPNIEIVSTITSIRERGKIDYLMKKYKPRLIFHAAAHKHVPLMESDPEEAIKNNVLGTQNLIELAEKNNVERFVLISTDKAVNPTNVMGATKRLAEIILEKKSKNSKTKYMAVRFGNVLGSNGSVIPIFNQLIKEGRNLKVTHKDITRYFMTIPEAAQLVLEAGSLGKGGEVFVLDMGEPVKILDLAKKMIKLSGLELGVDIDIEFIGLRPGEKLYEELLYDINSCIKTENNKIYIGKIKNENIDLKNSINELKGVIKTYNKDLIKEKLKEIVSTYREKGEK